MMPDFHQEGQAETKQWQPEQKAPVILLENGYTEKNTTEIYHNHLIKDFIGIEKIISEYL